jgi:hypothetical protein
MTIATLIAHTVEAAEKAAQKEGAAPSLAAIR